MAELAARLEPQLEKFRLSFDTVEKRKQNLGRAMDNLYYFLNLTGLIALHAGRPGSGGRDSCPCQTEIADGGAAAMPGRVGRAGLRGLSGPGDRAGGGGWRGRSRAGRGGANRFAAGAGGFYSVHVPIPDGVDGGGTGGGSGVCRVFAFCAAAVAGGAAGVALGSAAGGVRNRRRGRIRCAGPSWPVWRR